MTRNEQEQEDYWPEKDRKNFWMNVKIIGVIMAVCAFLVLMGILGNRQTATVPKEKPAISTRF